jgi:drug/metabolite transporter (DMT)-like permease
MTFGGMVLVSVAWASGGIASTSAFGVHQWSAMAFLGIFGGAVTFLLWSYALERTTPTRVAISVTINPIVSAVFGAYVLSEPITINLIAGLVLVAIGIAVATSNW